MASIKASLLRAKALYVGFVAGAPAVDNSTVEVNVATLRVKAGGITTNELDESIVDALAVDEVTLTQGTESIGIKNEGVDTPQIAEYAINALTPGVEVTYVFDVADHATQNVDFVLARSITVTSVAVISHGTNGSNANTWQLDNGTGGNHITDAISTNGKSEGGLVAAATIDQTYSTLADGATLRVVQTRAGGVNAARVVVKGFLA